MGRGGHHRILLIIAFCFLSLFINCGGQQGSNSTDGRSANAAREVTVYLSTDRVFSGPVLRAHQQNTGVKVNAVYDTEESKSTGLANRLLAEKNNPQADVFWSNYPMNLCRVLTPT